MRKTKILIMTIIIILMLAVNSFAGEVESKPGTVMWTSITANNAYIYCQNMKSQTSSIGSGNLNPHLSTAKDWDAVSVLAVSQYGACVSNGGSATYHSINGYNSTTSNSSGVMNWGKYSAQNGVTPYYAFTASFAQNGKNNAVRTSLFQNKGTAFVNSFFGGNDTTFGYGKIAESTATTYRNNILNKGLGIIRATGEEELKNETGGLSSYQYWGYTDASQGYYFNTADYPIIAKRELFGFYVGDDWGNNTSGGASVYTTFRPVLWNN